MIKTRSSTALKTPHSNESRNISNGWMKNGNRPNPQRQKNGHGIWFCRYFKKTPFLELQKTRGILKFCKQKKPIISDRLRSYVSGNIKNTYFPILY